MCFHPRVFLAFPNTGPVEEKRITKHAHGILFATDVGRDQPKAVEGDRCTVSACSNDILYLLAYKYVHTQIHTYRHDGIKRQPQHIIQYEKIKTHGGIAVIGK